MKTEKNEIKGNVGADKIKTRKCPPGPGEPIVLEVRLGWIKVSLQGPEHHSWREFKPGNSVFSTK